jgi:hypothetical protein
MRPLLTIIIGAAIVGLVQAYMMFQASLPSTRPTQQVEHQAQGVFSVEVVLTFDAAGDSFSLDPTAVVVEFQGQSLLKIQEPVVAGTPLTVESVPGVVEGRNEFFVIVSPKNQDQTVQRAVRVRILRDGVPVAEKSLWSESEGTVGGKIEITVPSSAVTDEHGASS